MAEATTVPTPGTAATEEQAETGAPEEKTAPVSPLGVYILAGITLVSSAVICALILAPASRRFMTTDLGMGLLLVPALASLASAWGGYLNIPRHSRSGWGLIAAGLTAWVGGAIVAAVEPHIWQPQSNATVSDLIYCLSYPLLLTGLWRLPYTAGSTWTRRRVLVDAAAGSIGLGVSLWHLFYTPIVGPRFPVDPLGAVADVAYLVGDVALIMFVAAILARRSRKALTPRTVFLLAAVTIGGVGDIAHVITSATTGTPALWVFLFWAVGFSFAALTGAAVVKPEEVRTSDVEFRWWQLAFPYSGVVLLAGIHLFGNVQGSGQMLVGAATWTITGLIVLRYRFAVKEKVGGVMYERTRLIASISHELRTPMTAVVGYLSLMRELADNMDEEMAEMVAAAEAESQRLARIVTDLIEVTRETGINVKPQDMPLSPVVREAVGSTGIDTELDLDDTLEVRADPGRVHQIVVNLVTNAYRYGGGQILVRARRDGEHAVIEVHDNGDGVPDEYQEIIWEEFQRGAHHLDSVKQGSGLGLPIVRRIAEAHGGDTGYRRSDILGGACFAVALPLKGHSSD